MPETRLSGVQKPCSLRAGSMEKRPAPRAAERGRNLLVERFSRFVKSRNGARRSRFQSSGAARGRAALTHAGTRGVGRAADRSNRERSGIDAGKGPGHAKPVSPFPATRRCRKSAEIRRRGSAARPCACVRARKPNAPAVPPPRTAKGSRARGQKGQKVRPDPSSCNGIRPGVIREDDANADYLSTPTSL